MTNDEKAARLAQLWQRRCLGNGLTFSEQEEANRLADELSRKPAPVVEQQIGKHLAEVELTKATRSPLDNRVGSPAPVVEQRPRIERWAIVGREGKMRYTYERANDAITDMSGWSDSADYHVVHLVEQRPEDGEPCGFIVLNARKEIVGAAVHCEVAEEYKRQAEATRGHGSCRVIPAYAAPQPAPVIQGCEPAAYRALTSGGTPYCVELTKRELLVRLNAVSGFDRQGMMMEPLYAAPQPAVSGHAPEVWHWTGSREKTICEAEVQSVKSTDISENVTCPKCLHAVYEVKRRCAETSGELSEMHFGRAKAFEKERDEEKRRRIYYQDIVYAVCNSLDKLDGTGTGIVCGTVDAPTEAVQERMERLVADSSKAECAATTEKVPDTWVDENEIRGWLNRVGFVGGYAIGRLAKEITELYNGGFCKGRDMALSLRVDAKRAENAEARLFCMTQRAEQAESKLASVPKELSEPAKVLGWVNVYPSTERFFKTRELAEVGDSARSAERIDCIPVQDARLPVGGLVRRLLEASAGLHKVTIYLTHQNNP